MRMWNNVTKGIVGTRWQWQSRRAAFVK
jgi:hypothetical protein